MTKNEVIEKIKTGIEETQLFTDRKTAAITANVLETMLKLIEQIDDEDKQIIADHDTEKEEDCGECSKNSY